MPFRQTPDTHTPYALIAFDKSGVERTDDPNGLQGRLSTRLLNDLSTSAPTDVFLFSHGWRGDMPAAIDQYNRWIDAMARLNSDASRMGADFRPMWIGLHWPSEPWGDEELQGASFAVGEDQPAPPPASVLLDKYIDRLDADDSLRARELLGVIFRENKVNAGALTLPVAARDAYNELATLLGFHPQGLGADPGSDNAPFDPDAAFDAMNAAGVAFGGGFFGGLLGPLRTLSFWSMKRRARTVGEGGMYQFVSQMQQRAPKARVHLIGHSFGTIVMSSIAGGPKGTTALPRSVDSLALLQGAVSLWAWADNIPSTGGKGYFNSSFYRPAVRGPMLTTRSRFDRAVGVAYPAAVSLVLQDPSFGPTEMLNAVKWGAIGAFGIQGLTSAVDMKMLPETSEYSFEPGKVYNLEASEYIKKMDGAAGAHSDIDGPQVAHALWQLALASTGSASTTTPVVPAPQARSTAPDAVVPASTPAVAVGAAAGAGSGPAVVAAPAVITRPADVAQPVSDAEMPLPFGITEDGAYLPEIKESDLKHIDRPPDVTRLRALAAEAVHLAPEVDIDPADLTRSGWGLVLSATMNPTARANVLSALKPLTDLRRQQVNNDRLFRIFDGPDAVQQGESARQWLNRQGSDLNLVVPLQGVPYYLMLVGSPDDLSFEFQYDLDTFFAVGRLSFDEPDDYGRYAANIVKYETSAAIPHDNTVALFNVRNDGDRATQLLHDQVGTVLAGGDPNLDMAPLGKAQGYSIVRRYADRATKDELNNVLRGNTEGGAPALLFTGSHGMAFRQDQLKKQGAIVTQDWGGPGSAINSSMYFTGADLPQDAKTLGMMHFFFACYSAGCPQTDTYSYDPNDQPVQIAPATMVAELPKRMLLSGAQAVIGHVDRGWAYSFQGMRGQSMVQTFRDPLVRLLRGERAGHAMDAFDQRWSTLSAQLLDQMNRRSAVPGSVTPARLANLWVARDDARNYILLGDPAVRLRRPDPSRGVGGVNGPVATASTGLSFGIPTEEEEPPAVSFAPPNVSARPKLKFEDFTGKFPVQAAVSPDCSYQFIKSVFADARPKGTVDAYIYSMSAPYLMALLEAARKNGSRVRVMYDPIQMQAANAKKLRDMGLDVKVAPSRDPRRVFSVCHQKFLVIDGKTVVLQSCNWAKSSIPDREQGERRKIGNREWLVRIDDAKVAGWYGKLFEADWNIPEQPSFAVEALEEPEPAFAFAARGAAPRDFPVMTFQGQTMTLTPLTSPDNYFDRVFPMIQHAKKRIWLQRQYFDGQPGPSVPRLLEAVARRKAAGIDVRLMASSRFASGWQQTKESVQEAGLTKSLRAINLSQFAHLHNKGVIVDDAVVISSTNWSENSIRSAREAGVLIYSAAVTDYFAQVFDDDWKNGWSIATADAGPSFDIVEEDQVEIDPADRD